MLKRAWIPAPTLPSLERPAAGATALHLFHVRENLLGHFATFIKSTRPSELHLLQEVLEIWWSNNLPADTSSAEIALAEAMAEELDRNERFIGVPRRDAKLVKQYVGFLKDGKAGCAA